MFPECSLNAPFRYENEELGSSDVMEEDLLEDL
jgi:hypothetical protein